MYVHVVLLAVRNRVAPNACARPRPASRSRGGGTARGGAFQLRAMLSAEQHREFRTHGFLVLKAALPPARIAAVRAEISDVLDDAAERLAAAGGGGC